MKIAVGILAYNEEDHIADTLLSLLQQSVFSENNEATKSWQWHITVVPNGCSDQTAARASRVFDKHYVGALSSGRINCQVKEIAEAGKSNAWNTYIHEFSEQDASIIIMIDADIIFGHLDTIKNSIEYLCDDFRAEVVVDTPLKHFITKEKKSWLETISEKRSRISLAGPPGIAGSFYCARGDVLRNIWMPIGLSGEDGFLRAMIITDLFRSPPDFSKVVRVDNASHYYEGLSRLKDIFQHELRMVIGTTLNSYLCWDFLAFATLPEGRGAGYFIKVKQEHNSSWYAEFINNSVKNRGWWVLPRGMLFRKIKKINRSGQVRLVRLVLMWSTFLLDLGVMVVANRKLKKGVVGYW